MKYIKVLFTSFIVTLIFIASNVNAQKKSGKYVWEKPFQIPDAVKPQFTNKDAVILDEEIEIEITPNLQATTAVRYAELYQSSTLTRTYQIKFLTQKGIDKFSKIKLPENFTPIYYDYDGAASRQNKFYHNIYKYCKVSYFAARYKRGNEKTQRALVDENYTDSNFFRLGEKERINSYEYQIKDLQVGDVVEISYRVYFENFMGFTVNPRFKIVDKMVESCEFYHWWQHYFNTEIAKQKTSLTFKYPYHYRLEWFNNNVEPIDTIKEKKLRGFKWALKDLDAVPLNSKNKLYKNLPNVYFYVHNLKYGDWSDVKLNEYLPYPWQLICRNNIGFAGDYKFTIQKLNAKERALSKVYKLLQEKHPESTLKMVNTLHQEIAKNFTYKSDVNHYFGLVNRINNIGAEINNKIISEEDRFEIYKGVFNRMGIDYYEAYFMDKRFGIIDKETPILPVNAIKGLAVLIEENFFFLLPKVQNKGLFFQELPFYLEGTEALLVKQNTDSYFNDNNILFVPTPKSTKTDNVRNVSAEITINSQNKATINSVELMSGQFSTILRPFYQVNQTNKFIPTKYYKQLFNFGKVRKQVKENKPLEFKEAYPFMSKKQQTFEVEDFVAKVEDGLYQFSIEKMINYFSPPINAINDNLPFYFDFPLTERYNFQFTFNEAIELIDNNSLAYNVDIEGVDYLFNVEQIDKHTLKVESIFSIDTEMVEKEKLSKLQLFLQVLSNNQKTVFTVKKLNNE